ncbi:hypothetical protein QQG74_17960 [Micromonospora sp. FIMYZ51]
MSSVVATAAYGGVAGRRGLRRSVQQRPDPVRATPIERCCGYAQGP